MYRIAVVQNGVEMQHSGYVDAIPKYKKFSCIGREKPEFTRFSGVNIRDLFNQGKNFLLEFDALIIGTNATSDDDVYNVLREEENREILQTFIEKGKGVLICSQKKYQSQIQEDNSEYKLSIDAKDDSFMRILDDTGKGELYYSVSKITSEIKSKKRISSILPQRYEYVIDERPEKENSGDGNIILVDEERTTLNQRAIFSLPHKITNELIDRRCYKNSFQKHYYRDIIIPVFNSAYQPVLIDKKDSIIRNVLMVAVPQKNERIVISTMALDWAGHEELLENIVNYLTRGIPNTAFIHKNNYKNSEMKILTLDAELSKVGYMEYCSIDDYFQNVLWHSLVVFSPDFSEKEVLSAWQKITLKNKFTKVYHYRNVEEELVLIKYSNNTYIEQQKIDVLTWLNSKRGKRLWDNSFWKTFDVIRLLHYMNDESFTSVISQIIDAIVYKDDKNKSHYKTDGSYDGVLAPTCGTLELLKWAKNNEYYAKTQNYLINKFYTEENVHNKMFIIRSFACSSDPELSSILENFSIESITNLKDLTDLDLCLYIEIAIILYNNLEKDKSVNKQWIISSLEELIYRQMQNGKWDSLSNTSSILIFLLQYLSVFETILKDQNGQELFDKIKDRIDRGIAAIKIAYSSKGFNWENNIVTTANCLLVLFLYDEKSGYKSKDFLNFFVEESKVAANYNALNLALQTLNDVMEDLNKCSNNLSFSEIQINELQNVNNTLSKRLYITGMVSGFSITIFLSICVQLALNVPNELAKIISDIFMWIPVAMGTVIPAIVFSINKKINTINKVKNQNKFIKSKRRKNK